MKTYKIPPKFYLDHRARGCGDSGKVLKATKTYLIVELDQLAYDDLLSDALYYVEIADTLSPAMPSLIASARAIIKQLTKENN